LEIYVKDISLLRVVLEIFLTLHIEQKRFINQLLLKSRSDYIITVSFWYTTQSHQTM